MHVGMVQNLQNIPRSLPTRVQVNGINQIFALLDYLIGSWLITHVAKSLFYMKVRSESFQILT